MTMRRQLFSGRDDGLWIELPVGVTTFLSDSGNLYLMRGDGRLYHESCKWEDLPPPAIGVYS